VCAFLIGKMKEKGILLTKYELAHKILEGLENDAVSRNNCIFNCCTNVIDEHNQGKENIVHKFLDERVTPFIIYIGENTCS